MTTTSAPSPACAIVIICGVCEHEWSGPADGPCPNCGNACEDHVPAERVRPTERSVHDRNRCRRFLHLARERTALLRRVLDAYEELTEWHHSGDRDAISDAGEELARQVAFARRQVGR